MKNNFHIITVDELFPPADLSGDIRGDINCIELDSHGVSSQFSSPIFLDASIAILVLSGTAVFRVNYKTLPIKANTMILLSASHLFYFKECSFDFTCLCQFVSKKFMDDMDSTDMIYRRIKYGVKMYNEPVMQLNNDNTALLLERLTAVNRAIDNTGHLYYKEMILNTLFAFYLDLSNIIDRRPEFYNEGNVTRYESIIKSFIELLVTNYRKEHKVDFYASQLNISAHYLTFIVKRSTGQSVSDFIFEMLYSEARTLLSHSKLSIQEITTILNFSDQSSFGKFFKRKAGLSPVDYRKNQK